MADRNEKRDILINDHKFYKDKMRERGLPFFRHFSKMKISYIAPDDMENLTIIDHIFVTGDSLSKLAYKYYGDTSYWWVLASFNKKPIDNLIKLGDTIHIPLPLEEVVYLLDRE
jgi:hypothetical protein